MFRKLTRLQQGSCSSDYTEGKILGLLGENKVVELMAHKSMEMAWAITSISMSLYILITYMGWSYLCFMIVSSALLRYLAKLYDYLKPQHEAHNKLRDAKNSLLSEVFNNIKMLKLYGW